MTKLQYALLLRLHHEFSEAFFQLSAEIRTEYFDILFGRKQPTASINHQPVGEHHAQANTFTHPPTVL